MLTMAMATTAMAAEYNIDGPEDPLFASPTSVDQVTVVGGGVTEQSNIDRIAFVTLREMSLAYHSFMTFKNGVNSVDCWLLLSTPLSTAIKRTPNSGNRISVYIPISR